MRTTLALGLSMLLTGQALAEDSPESMIARGHYKRGAAAYENQWYEDALHEFEAAHAAEPLPALDYNIARCLDHMGPSRRAEALAAYERFLRVDPAAASPGNAEVYQRIAILKHELAEAPVAVVVVQAQPERPPAHRWLIPGATGGGALAFAIVGGALVGSAASSFHHLSSTCSPACSSGSWSSLPAREHAGEALLGIAAAALVVDVYLLIRTARHK